MPILESYIRSSIQIRASENLNNVMVVAAGGGNLEPEVSKSTLRDWEEQAGVKREKRNVRISTDGPELLGSMGIKVDIVHKKKKEEE